MARLTVVLSFIVTVALAGCGDGKVHLKHYPVKGKVTLNGKPVTKCIINLSTLAPVKGGDGGYSGKLDDNGEFTIKSTTGESGAPPGKYKVTFYTPPEEAMKAMTSGKGKKGYEAANPFPPEYSSAQTSKKEIEVKPESNNLTIEL